MGLPRTVCRAGASFDPERLTPREDTSVGLLARVLKQAGVARTEWEAAEAFNRSAMSGLALPGTRKTIPLFW